MNPIITLLVLIVKWIAIYSLTEPSLFIFRSVSSGCFFTWFSSSFSISSRRFWVLSALSSANFEVYILITSDWHDITCKRFSLFRWTAKSSSPSYLTICNRAWNLLALFSSFSNAHYGQTFVQDPKRCQAYPLARIRRCNPCLPLFGIL